MEEVAVKDAEPTAPAALQEHDNVKSEEPVEEEKPEVVVKQAESADPKADSVDKAAEKVEIEKAERGRIPNAVSS